MKVILTTNLKKLGKVGDLVNVKSGYARNFLFPKKFALRNSKENKEYFNKIKDEIDAKEEEKKENAKTILKNIQKLRIEFHKESDEKDQLYGAISKKEILNYLEEKEIKILADDLKILQPIRTLGEHMVEINPYEDLVEQIKIIVKKN
tara:strand:+ start:496 stop:939 length:444 start_codon:yes stop_codon:yes gene_type:complete